MRPVLKILIVLLGLPLALLFTGMTWWFMFSIVGAFAVEALALIASVSVFGLCSYVGFRAFGFIETVGIRTIDPSAPTVTDTMAPRSKNRSLEIDEFKGYEEQQKEQEETDQDNIDSILAQVNKDRDNTAFDVTEMYQDEYGSVLDNVEEDNKPSPAIGRGGGLPLSEDYLEKTSRDIDDVLPQELQNKVSDRKKQRGLPKF